MSINNSVVDSKDKLKKIYNRIFPFFGSVEEILELLTDTVVSPLFQNLIFITSIPFRVTSILQYWKKIRNNKISVKIEKADFYLLLGIIATYLFEKLFFDNLLDFLFSYKVNSVEKFIFRLYIISCLSKFKNNNLNWQYLLLLSIPFFLKSASTLVYRVGGIDFMDNKLVCKKIKFKTILNNDHYVKDLCHSLVYILFSFTLFSIYGIIYAWLFNKGNHYETTAEYNHDISGLLKFELADLIGLGIVILFKTYLDKINFKEPVDNSVELGEPDLVEIEKDQQDQSDLLYLFKLYRPLKDPKIYLPGEDNVFSVLLTGLSESSEENSKFNTKLSPIIDIVVLFLVNFLLYLELYKDRLLELTLKEGVFIEEKGFGLLELVLTTGLLLAIEYSYYTDIGENRYSFIWSALIKQVPIENWYYHRIIFFLFMSCYTTAKTYYFKKDLKTKNYNYDKK